MIPEIGFFSLLLALCFAIIQSSSIFNKKNPQTLAKLAVFGQLSFLALAMLCLILSFVNNDMTVIYVREHSHQLLPLLYKIGAAWGGHEGSLLLWCLILSGWTASAIIFTNSRFAFFPTFNSDVNSTFFTKMLSILGLLSTGFISFLLFTSDPFQRNYPLNPITGNDLTPILQDPGLIFHPPMLYLGYVGFVIAFAFAISALLEGKLDKSWAKACRPWVILPWSFLSCGIVLGSWWAYRELGWGGWWFWDPVENASLLPWLAATALIHSLIVSEKRDTFKGWTILLAIVTFTLSLLGTFLVRSGVLVSVHAFANDPTRGLFLLVYLAVIICGALLLYASRIHRFYRAPNFELFSRETFLLINSVFLLAAVVTIVIGTLYPIILDALDFGKISVGEPYFNTVFTPIILPLLLCMGIAPHIHWGQHQFKQVFLKIWLTLLLSIVVGISAPIAFGFPIFWLSSIGICVSVWIIFATIQYAYQLWKTNRHFEINHWSMVVAHIGIAIVALGVTVNKTYSVEQQIRIHPGEITTIANYTLAFKDVTQTNGENYQSYAAKFDIIKNNESITTLTAEQRTYTSHEESLSKPGVTFNLWRDLYLALGNAYSDGSWSVRIYYKPFVRWIWAGGFLLLIGGLLSVLGYFKKRAAI